MTSHTLNVDNAWNAVSLEERLELIAKCQAFGILAASMVFIFVGAIAYGFDQIWLLLAGVAMAVIAMPAFASYSWRRHKPTLILNYLAVRSVARRYAYGYVLPELGFVIIFRGRITRIFSSKEEEELFKQQQEVDLDDQSNAHMSKDVWICLLRGGIIALSEQKGGARLEYITAISPNVVMRKGKREDGFSEDDIIVEGIGNMPGRKVVIQSKYPGTLYVFERKLARLIENSKDSVIRLAAQWQNRPTR